MANFKLSTPVALIIFNRPDKVEKVFKEIKKVKPSKILVIGDGPRQEKFNEEIEVAASRDIINRIDWTCEILTNYSDVNLGCKERVSSGLDWVFDQVEEAIILEDDCIPDQTFFRFCQELLEKYRSDTRIGAIGGVNFQFGKQYNTDSFYFSKYVHVWGWASWRNRWQDSYDVSMKNWPFVRRTSMLDNITDSKWEKKYWTKIFDSIHKGEIDTWDYQWVFANWLKGRMSILPSVNLVSNIGFEKGATHTIGYSELANLKREKMHFPLSNPTEIRRNIKADRVSEKKCFRLPITKRLRNRIIGMIK